MLHVESWLEHLTLTGSGIGVNIINRAAVHLECNDIRDNMESGVFVLRSSSAVCKRVSAARASA